VVFGRHCNLGGMLFPSSQKFKGYLMHLPPLSNLTSQGSGTNFASLRSKRKICPCLGRYMPKEF
jgi:hypothetical protein